MTLQEIVQMMMQEPDKYAVRKETMVPVGEEPVRKHKKKRIQKKWIRRYGMRVKYEKRMAKVIDVDMNMIIDFCQEKNIPITDLFDLNNNTK